MSNNGPELRRLEEQLKTYSYRTRILYFQLLANRYNSRCRFLLNSRQEFHLNDCVWSLENATCGPDTCHCHLAISNPEEFLDDRMKNPNSYLEISKMHDVESQKLKKDPKPLVLGETDESLDDFYQYRVLDSENVYKWFEKYKSKTNALKFQVKVRETRKQDLIDAIYNSESGEWHLTDCSRCVDKNARPDTCHCHKAMIDPWKYLQETYNFVDVKAILGIKQKIPKNYKTALVHGHFHCSTSKKLSKNI